MVVEKLTADVLSELQVELLVTSVPFRVAVNWPDPPAMIEVGTPIVKVCALPPVVLPVIDP
ncbi:MAG: hypothetical protein DMG95_02960 [Acidobacteria bacterium]|nr:MAG: hypothetical protein DMG95_02960 [Acidobacteriota bacterium]